MLPYVRSAEFFPPFYCQSMNRNNQYPGVKLILQSTRCMTNFILRVTDDCQENSEVLSVKLLQVSSRYIERYPRVLLEFKLICRKISQDILGGYIH